jgi:hypothetical protein
VEMKRTRRIEANRHVSRVVTVVSMLIVLLVLQTGCSNMLFDDWIDPDLSRTGTVVPREAMEGDNLGTSISTDGSQIVVGATNAGGGTGTAYVLNGYSFREISVLTADDGQTGDQFGVSVAVTSGQAIVGAQHEDGGEGDCIVDSGAAYLFSDATGIWQQTAVLRAGDAQTGDLFGSSVAISADWAFVGAVSEDGGAGDVSIDAGAVYVFHNDAGVWSQAATLRAPDNIAHGAFGASLAVSGEWLMVGSPERVSGAGGAFLFRFDGSVWAYADVLVPVGWQYGDLFGTTIALSGDTAVIGAVGRSTSAGMVYVFTRDGDTWIEGPALVAPDGQPDDLFGRSVAVSYDWLLVGAPGEDGGEGDPLANVGSAYAFRFRAGAWEWASTLRTVPGAAADAFGTSVGIARAGFVVGANQEGGTGAVHYFRSLP